MPDLPKLEHLLNSDPKLRAEFFKDPVGILRQHGIKMTDQAEHDVRECIAKVTSSS